MRFVAMEGNPRVGQWNECDPDPAPTGLLARFSGLFQKQKRPATAP